MNKMLYFDNYHALIKMGMINICENVKMAIERVERYKKQYKFKQHEANKRIRFIETDCSHTKGQKGALKLALPQKVWLEVSWGFYHDVEVTKTNPDTMEEYTQIEERRLINQTPIIVPRGTGKTTMAAGIGKVGQLIDGEWGADVQILAYNREQAGYAFNASRAMNSRKDSLLYLLKEKDLLRSTKQGEMYFPSNSLMSIKTSDYESLDGTNGHYNIFDEVHTYDDDFIKVVNDGSSKKRTNWMTWYISTNGTKRDKIFDKYFDLWVKILKGEIDDDSIMPWLYSLDDPKEIHDDSLWDKAMPLLGITTSKEDIWKEINIAKDDPVAQAEIMAKTFNLPVNNYLSYFSNKECKGNSHFFDKSLFKGTEDQLVYTIVGVDLSDVDDICSINFMTIRDGKFFFHSRNYIPRSTYEELQKTRKDEYDQFELDGDLIIHEMEYNDQDFIFDDIYQWMCENHIFPLKVGYDNYNSRTFINRFRENYGLIDFQVKQVPKVLSYPLKVYKSLLKNGRIVFDSKFTTWCHANVKVKIDANFNIFPNKKKAADKIDGFASALDCFITWEEFKHEIQYYFDLGDLEEHQYFEGGEQTELERETV